MMMMKKKRKIIIQIHDWKIVFSVNQLPGVYNMEKEEAIKLPMNSTNLHSNIIYW